MINSNVILNAHTITRKKTYTQAISHNHTNSSYSQDHNKQTVTPIRPTPILGLIRPGNNSVYHARERRRAAGESRQHVNMLQRMTPKVMHGPCQAAFR